MEKYESYFENNVEYTKVTLKDLKENIYNNNIEKIIEKMKDIFYGLRQYHSCQY